MKLMLNSPGVVFFLLFLSTAASVYTYEIIQPVRLLVNDRKFSAGNSVFLSHQTSQQ